MTDDADTGGLSVRWHSHCHGNEFGTEIFGAGFPSLHGTSIAISTFSPRKILDTGPIFSKDIRSKGGGYLSLLDHLNDRRIYAVPDSEANASLSLQCCFEGDSFDWEANSAYFNNGKLVAIVSYFNKSVNMPEQHRLSQIKRGDLGYTTLMDIYKDEISRVAENLIGYKGNEDLFSEMVRIVQAESPQGEGLHNSYRNAIKEVLPE
ncbi:hypothetical protein CMI42_01900 [Candidatus Pacearchaeota archaeon]|nr:hypothetical protein [Candidatus Pacearchaeota archaeon]